ncbi:MAG TPA: hypothetical protein DCY13_03555, partial [Verrucomicrobiales bacterium]|nr:hypothetical protein [Verrucomicrobiales bacterium]
MNEPTKEREFDVAIVGAGIAGLMTARQLVAAGRSVIVLDKGRGVGGRMATRRSGPVVFDHGAQYFTARDPDFLRLVNAWEQEGLVRQWARGFATMDGGRKIDETPRWTGVDGMTCIAKDLAADLNLRLQQTVTAVRQQTRGWRVALAEGDSVAAGALLLTPPVPQSLQLLRKGQVQLPHDIRAALERIRYAPCLALLIELAGPSRVPAPGGLWGDGRPIA